MQQQLLRLQHQRVPTTVNRSSGHLRVVAMAAEGAGGPEDVPSEGPLPPGPAPQESPGKTEAEAVATARPLRQKAAAAAARERREQRRAAREQPAAEEVPASAELTSPELWRREEAEALAAEEAAAAFVSVAPEPAPEPSLEPEAEPEPELGAELDLEAGPGPEQEPQPEPEPALSVECPEGCGAGDLLNVEVEGGVVQVEVPEGVAAGDVFEVHLAHGADGEAAAEGVGAEHEQDEPGTESDDSGSDVDVDAAAAAALELELAADSPPSVPAGRRRAPAVPARGGHTTAAAANEVGDARKARLDKIAAERKAAAVPRRGDRLRVQRNSRKAPPAPAIDAPLEEMQGAVAADSVSCEDDELRTLEVRLLGLSLERLRDRAEAVGVDQDALEDIDVETDRDSAKLEIVALILTLAKHAQDLGKTSPSASLLSSATLLSELHQQETAAAVRLQSNVRGTLVRREYQARLAKRVEPTSVTSVEDSPAAQAAAARQQKGIELLHWLSALRCQEYLTKLVEFGVESVADMAEVTEQDLVEQGMKPLHRRRVLRAAAALAIEEDTGADASEEEEFTEVEEVESDDDGGADEDFDTMKKAIETSSALTPRRGRPDYVSPYSQRKLRLSPANSSGSAEGRKSSSPPQTSITPRSETEAKLLVSNDVTVAKRKLRAMSYGTTGQDPRNLFNNYDRDNSGELDWSEFKSAVRKGGKVSTATLSDGVLRKLFDAVDGDGSGDVSIEELTAFVWGNQNRLGAEDGSSAADRAAPPADEIEMAIDGALSLPSKAERDQAFDRMDENGNGALSFAEIDKAIVEIWPEYHHKKSIMRAYKAADVDGSGYIGRKEFGLLLKYLVYFNQMWDKFAELDRDGDGRLDVNEFHDGAQMLGLDVTWAATVEEFGAMDEDGGGTVMFDEFCAWCARRGVPKGGTGSTKKRTSVSQKESASRLSSSAYAGRLARSSPASAPQGKSPPSGQQDEMKSATRRGSKSGDLARASAVRTSITPRKKSSGPPQTSITPHGETEAKLLVSNDVTVAKRKLRAMSYGTTGQDPRNLFNNYDRDNSGELDWSEFKSAVRKGGKVSTATLSDGVLRKLFDAVDGDGSGDVSIEELTAFVWGNQNRLGAEDGSSAADRAAPPADEIEMAIDGALSLPSKAERDQAFDRMDENGNGALSFAEIDKAIVEIWPEYHHKKSIMRAYKAADVDGSGYIGRKEFGLLLKYLVYFNQMWDKFAELDRDGDGRLDVNEFHDGAQMLGLDVTWAATVEEFGAMDEDGGGTVMFDEFCAWCARRGVPKGGTGSTKKRTSVSQKESASRLSSSAYAGRLARSSPASTPQGKSPPSGQQDKMKTPMSGAELPVAVAAMLDQAGLSSAGKQKCRRHASDLARGDLLLLNDSHAVRHFVRQRLGFDRVRDAEDTAKLCDWIRLEKEVEAAGLESTGPDDSRFRRTRFEFVKGLHDVVLIDPGHYQGGGVVSYIATDRGHCGASSDPVWVNPHTAARMVVSWSSARNGQEAMLVRAALRPHQKDKALLSTDDRRGSWMQLDLASRRSSKNSAQLIAASSTDPTGRAPMRDRMMRRMKVDRYVLQNAGLGRALGRWQLQGANEDEVGDPEEPVQWTVLHDGSGMPRENHAIADFAVSPPHSFVEEDDDNDSRNYFRFFRIVQFGRNVGCDGSDAVRRYLSDLGHERQVSQEGAANIRVYATHTAEVVFVLSAPRFGYDQSDYVCVLREMQRSKTLNSFLAACLKAHAVDRAAQFLPHVVGGTSAADVEAKVMRRAAWDSTPTASPRSPISGSDSSRGRPGRSSGSSRSSRGGKRLEVPDDQPLPSGTEVFVKPGYATRYVPTDTGRAPGVIVEYLLPQNRYAVELDTGDRLWPVHPELIEERASIDGDYRLSLGGIELYGVLREQRQTS